MLDTDRRKEVVLAHSPSKVQQRLCLRRHTHLRPGQEVELGDGASLASAQIFQIERTYEVIITPDVLTNQVNLLEAERKREEL